MGAVEYVKLFLYLVVSTDQTKVRFSYIIVEFRPAPETLKSTSGSPNLLAAYSGTHIRGADLI